MEAVDAKLVVQQAKQSVADKEYEIWLLRAQLQQLTQVNTMLEVEIQKLRGESDVEQSN